MLSIGRDDLAILTIFRYGGGGGDLAKLIIFRSWGDVIWFGRLIIHRMGNFPLTRKILGGGAAGLLGAIHPPLDLHPCRCKLVSFS